MRKVLFGGNPLTLEGKEVKVGDKAPNFTALKQDLTPYDFHKETEGKVVIISAVPSVDTSVCEFQTTHFNETATSLSDDVQIVTVSCDLPFAQKRFCGAEGIANAETMSSFRSTFARDYGLQLQDGPLAGLCSRAVIVLDENNKVLYTEQVADIVNEPNYDAAMKSLNNM